MAKKKPVPKKNDHDNPLKDVYSVEAISKDGTSTILGMFHNAGSLAKIVVYGVKPSTKLVRGGKRNTGDEAPLNDVQIQHLAELVYGTTKDIKRLAKTKYRHKWNDMDDARLSKCTFIVRCTKCETWVHIQETEEGDVCSDCFVS